MAASTHAADLRNRADWRSVEQLYGQFTSILSKGERIPPEVAGTLATSLGRVLAFYEDTEHLFVADLRELWSEIDDLQGSEAERFRALYYEPRLNDYPEYKYPPDEGVRRRPRPFESAVETSRRLIDINGVRHALSGMQTGAILGGSVSYGRFYNVTGAASEFGSKASDSDLLLVLKSYDDLKEVAEQLRSVRGVDPVSLALLTERTSMFNGILSRYPRCIFSHKLKFWTSVMDPILEGTGIPAQYALSLHIFSLADFDHLTLKDIAVLHPDPESGIFERGINDYRDSQPGPKGAYDKKSFSGIPLGEHKLNPIEVAGGYVTNVQVCLIQNDRYCPGLHQNLVLPQFEKRWESNAVRLYLRMLTFRWKILERLHIERTMRPFERQEISLSHVRYFVFSPHITRRADRDSHV